MTQATTFDTTHCALGEGPLWHPERGQLFWFDINAGRLHTRTGEEARHWDFGQHASAAGWLDRDRLLVATETALAEFDIETGATSEICPLEADNPVTRSNDGRADPHGGFWIGTMGKKLEPGAGAIYRYHRGELRRLYAPWTIPNAICFAPDGTLAYLADSPTKRIWRQRLDGAGWPSGDPEPFVDLPAESRHPDGAVVDAEGSLWCAHYGHALVTVHAPDGRETRTIRLPAAKTTCPAFGGADLRTLFVTTARQETEDPSEHDGRTFAVDAGVAGQREFQVIL